MKNFWDNISLIGLRHLSKEEIITKHRSTVLINRMGAVIILLMLLFMPLEMIMNGFRLIPFVVIDALSMSALFFLNYKHKYEAAKYLFLVLGIVLIVPSTLLIGHGAGNELVIIPASTLGILLLRNKNAGMLYALFTLLIFGIIFYVRSTINPIIDLEPEVLKRAYPFFAGMTLIIVAAVVYYFRNINEDFHEIIEDQREELEKSNETITEKNKEITDSINYAQNIQRAFLPSIETFQDIFSDAFILFQPKDIVSGDFYWFHQSKETGSVFVTAADCTGHGVPGALMSIICSNALHDVIVTQKIEETGKILDETRKDVIHMLRSTATSGRKDGMDISFVRINKDKFEVQFSGANNPIWIIKNGSTEVLEIKGDKQPIGQFERSFDFSSHALTLEKGDCIYLFTDGYADQFGGPKGKKFKYAQLKKTLISITKQPMQEQQKLLLSTLNNWKGELEQVDDVCVIGIRL